MVAKDSPLQIDCPQADSKGISLAPSDLDAAIARFRLTAHTWQALTEKYMRMKGLGRSTFRLEEEWAFETLSKETVSKKHVGAVHDIGMQSTAKVHLVRSEKTVAELRDVGMAPQNRDIQDPDVLHGIFTQALSVFDPSKRPIVAGMILNSHYSMSKNLILAHVTMGLHHPNGLSLGMMGSHLAYSWPRFLDEIPNCLLDLTVSGDAFGNDSTECRTLWKPAPLAMCFVSYTAHSVRNDHPGTSPVTDETPNGAKWDIRDAVHFSSLPHFQQPDLSLPGDTVHPKIEIQGDEDFRRISVSSEASMVALWFDGRPEDRVSTTAPSNTVHYTHAELEARFRRDSPRELEVLSRNGKGIRIINA